MCEEQPLWFGFASARNLFISASPFAGLGLFLAVLLVRKQFLHVAPGAWPESNRIGPPTESATQGAAAGGGVELSAHWPASGPLPTQPTCR